MPFTVEAKNGTDEWHKISIVDYETPRLDLNGYSLRCPDPDCHGEMIIKQGLVVTPHFAHKANSAARECIFVNGSGESEEHRVAKLEIMRRLSRSNRYRGAHIEFERILKIDGRKRRADVYVEWPDGGAEIHEIELKRTTIDECRERTDDYYKAGATAVVWWFGRDNGSDQSLHRWAERECGFYGILQFEVRPFDL